MKKTISVLCMVLCLITPRSYAAERQYGPIEANETLYRIALKYRQPGVTMAQLMMTIFQNNTEAFDQGNINRLKLGAVLKIPEFKEVGRVGRKQAVHKATTHIETYQKEVADRKLRRGELTPPGQAPRNPDRLSGIVVATNTATPDSEQIGGSKQLLAYEQPQQGQISLPEPKPASRKPRKKSAAPLFRYSYDLSIVDDDNVRLAQEDEDIRSDLILSPTIKARAGKKLDSFTILNYGGSLSYNLFETFDELNNYEFDINTRYRFALSSGFTAPIYSLSAKIGGQEFESEMRDSSFLSLSADLNKWMTNTVNMTAGFGLKRRESVSEVFDNSEARLFVNFDTEISKSDLIYTTFTWIRGDRVSSATPSLAIINAADAIEPDDAFGGIAGNQFAYRIEANTVVLTLGYNRILTPKMSFDLSARFVKSVAVDDDDIGYYRNIIRASLLGRF